MAWRGHEVGRIRRLPGGVTAEPMVPDGMLGGMFTKLRPLVTQWTTVVPLLAFLVLVLTWHRDLPGWVVGVVSCFLAGAVLAAVHHAEVVAHRVGEPFGSLVLAVAVTVIEVALIVTLMADGGDKAATLARDTVFAAVMITCNGILGLSILAAAFKYRAAVFNAEGTGAALATIGTLATLSLVLPTFTTSSAGPQFAPGQPSPRTGSPGRWCSASAPRTWCCWRSPSWSAP